MTEATIPPSAPEPEPEPSAGAALRSIGVKEVLQSLIGFSIAIALLVFGLPRIAGTTWPEILDQMQLVGVGSALAMAGLLLAGLYCYTFTLIGSLPGLSHLRALMVNAAGSMVSNLLPGGGAVGVALSYVMFRSWGFARRAISTSIVVTSIWNLLARLTLPVLGALSVILGPVDAPRPVVLAALIATAVGLIFIGFFTGLVYSDRFAREVGGAVTTLAKPLAKRFPRVATLDSLIEDQRSRIDGVVRNGSIRMTLGLVGMFGFFFILYWVSARSVGMELAVIPLFAAYTFRQFLTVVAITPGGLGVTEVGTAGILVAFGADPASASAAALLYAVFTHLLEVPLGITAWAGWLIGRKRTARQKAARSQS